MEKIDRFNIRVYGLIIHDEKIMILREPYAGEVFNKFPGGGLEFGEGLIDGLRRELKEELNLEFKDFQHFYTQDEFVRSRFRQNEQLLTIYYKVNLDDISDLKQIDSEILEIKWIYLKDLKANDLDLPVDKRVVQLLLASEN